MDIRRILAWIFTQLFFKICYGNLPGTISNANNIFDALTKTLTCGQFQTLIQSAGLDTQDMYISELRLTLFVPNNTAFQQLPANKLNEIINMTPTEKEDFVRFYTVGEELMTSSINANIIKKSLAAKNNRLFFNSRTRRITDIGGNAGTSEYFVNGALIIRPNVRAGNGIVHVIDRVLEKSIPTNAYAYIKMPNNKAPKQESAFFRELVSYVTGDYKAQCVFPLQYLEKLTLFLPTDEAISRIPIDKLEELRSTQPKLTQVIQQHIIQNRVIYTSFVYHNEGFNAMYGRNIFKKNIRDNVYISGGGVNAEIVRGNLTVENGAVHYVDTLLGFVYNTARDQIQLDKNTRQFEDLTNRGRKELQDYLVRPSGVTVFTPTNDAFAAVANIPGVDLYNNASLIDMVLKRSFLEPGDAFELTSVNGDYDSKFEIVSQYRGKKIKVYSQGNDTWVEGGYVKARVIRPDIGVTNGFVHYIDGIFGVPSRDLPGIIFCEDWLIKTSYVMSTVNLNNYMRDVRITTSLPPCPQSAARQHLTYVNTQTNNQNSQQTRNSNSQNPNKNINYAKLNTGGCGESNRYCEFTMFIPNGTAIDNFQMTELGLRIMADRNRLRYVFKRHIIQGKRYYLDALGRGAHNMKSDNGELLRLNKQNDRYAEILFQGQRARVLHSDIGATNGVIHIIDRVLHVPQDLTREINAATPLYLNLTFLLFTFIHYYL